MNIIAEFIQSYGLTILYAILTTIAGYGGLAAKNLYKKYANDETKRAVCLTVVKAVEQLYCGLDGANKLKKAQEAISDMLYEKNIHITELEMNMLIEAAVAEFSSPFGELSIYSETAGK